VIIGAGGGSHLSSRRITVCFRTRSSPAPRVFVSLANGRLSNSDAKKVYPDIAGEVQNFFP
jgi:hypothetical protein